MKEIISNFLEKNFNARFFTLEMEVKGETRDYILRQLEVEKYNFLINKVIIQCTRYSVNVELTCIVDHITIQQFWELCSRLHFKKPIKIYPSDDGYATFVIATRLED